MPFGVVCGEDGKKFKTRSGETTRLVDLLDEAVRQMLVGMRERVQEQQRADATGGRAGLMSMSDEELQHAASVLGYGAVKYADLKSNRISNYIFSYERMLDPEGNTAVYLLYAGARISSILRKAPPVQELLANGAHVELTEEAEAALGNALLRFPEVIEQMLSTLQPNFICEYLYDLCRKFTKFYQACKVIGSPQQNSRLVLLTALENVLRTGYSLVGIGYLERI